jgi:hypothetical protein
MTGIVSPVAGNLVDVSHRMRREYPIIQKQYHPSRMALLHLTRM